MGLTFYGVDGSSYSETFPADTTLVKIGKFLNLTHWKQGGERETRANAPLDNPTVVKSIYSNGGGFCTITGVDGSTVVIAGEGNYTVTPAQAQASGSSDNL